MLSQPENVHTGSTPTQPRCSAHFWYGRCANPATVKRGEKNPCCRRTHVTYYCDGCIADANTYGPCTYCNSPCDLILSEPVRLRGNR